MKKFLFLLPILAILLAMETNVDAQTVNTPGSFYINGSMGRLFAIMEMPELPQSGKCPMVILCHGFRGNLDYHLWAPLAQILNAHGIGVLRFDFNGNGRSEGEFENMTVPNEIDDLMNVISHVRGLPTTASVSLVGHSQGGVVCGMAAGICGETQIKCLGLLSAAAVLRDDALRGFTMGAQYNPWHLDKPYYTLASGERLGRAYIQTAMNLPIYETTEKFKGPALIFNGMADQVVPYTYAQRYKDVLPQGELVIMPGEDHSCSVNPQFVINLVSEWLINELGGEKGE